MTVEEPSMQFLKSLLPRKIRICHVGGLPIDEPPIYTPLIEEDIAHLISLDAQDENPIAIGTYEKATLHTCRAPGMSSLLRPDLGVLVNYPFLYACAEVTKKEEIILTNLDTLIEPPIDLLVIDVQGSELDVLLSGPKVLASTSMLQVEVPYVTLYENQPSLEALVKFIKTRDFQLHTILPPHTALLAPFANPTNPHAGANQVIDGDWVFVRNSASDKDAAIALAAIAHWCLGSYDLAARCLLAGCGEVTARMYLEHLTENSQ